MNKLILPFLMLVIAQAPDHSPTLQDYEEYLGYYKKLAPTAFETNTWKDIKLKDKADKDKIILFTELNPLEQNMFCLFMGNRLSKEMTKLDEFWKEEAKKFDDPNYKPVPHQDPKQKSALKEDVLKYKKQLLEVRKKFAVSYETFAEKAFKKFEQDIPKEERENNLKQIREFNDKHKLIERK